MENKTWIIIALSVGIILIFAQNMMLQRENSRIAYEYTKTDESCFLWVLDDDNKGFATKTEYCGQLGVACTAPYHNLDCKWIRSPILLENGSESVTEGCSCKG